MLKVLVTKLCQSLCDPYGLQLLCAWNSLGKNTRVGYHSLLQGIFPTQGLILGLLHGRQIFTTQATLSVYKDHFSSPFSIRMLLNFKNSNFRFTEEFQRLYKVLLGVPIKLMSYICDAFIKNKKLPSIQTTNQTRYYCKMFLLLFDNFPC